MELFQPLVLTTHYSSCSCWLVINSARIPRRRKELLQCSRSVATACQLQYGSIRPTGEKSLSDSAELVD